MKDIGRLMRVKQIRGILANFYTNNFKLCIIDLCEIKYYKFYSINTQKIIWILKFRTNHVDAKTELHFQ